ncbi:MAG TPA: hypothetical protein DC064_19240, partial [Cyanobacteria bacterium UBA9273]|nr:hypothetical protein [Cyanobacteria bacterium UBA9273]
MSTGNSSAGNLPHNEQSLQELAWAIEMSEGQFSLIFARCNYTALRKQMIQRLREICSVPIREILLKPPVQKLYSTIRQQLGDEMPSAVMVCGLDGVSDIDHLLTSMNSVREEFRKNCPFPLVLWIDDEISRKLTRLAPDFKSWGTLTEFAIAPDELLAVLRQKAKRVFLAVLEAEGEDFLPNEAIFDPHYRLELDAALRDLDRYGQKLTPDLEACLQFVRGRDAYAKDQIDEALTYYATSLAFWQQPGTEQENRSQNLRLRAGVVLFHRGLCYYRKAELHKADRLGYYKKARDDFQQTLVVFEESQQPHLVAKFISHLGEVLRHLENWDELEILAQKSQQLHEIHGTSVQRARDYGFLAEVALQKHNLKAAKALAQKAIATLAEVAADQQRERGWYLLLLARSQRQLGEVEEAINSLNRAKSLDPSDNPQRYIEILVELRSLYLDQHCYRDAFEVKQERRSIEQQFGFRAFIGAGRLQSQRQAKGVLTQTEELETVSQEIIASGRKQDVDNLISRIESTHQQVTVIHGLSGVGKSSLVNAGLIPALKLKKSSGTSDIFAIPLRVYNDWPKELGQIMAQELDQKGMSLSAIPDSPASLITELHANEERNLLTILIFDQFEEFFFVCSEPKRQEIFLNFLEECLKITNLKIILSLREDYLHYLLAVNRINSSVVNKDILGKNILYRLGNLQPEAAKELIHSLTVRSQFYMDDALIDELVKDLAGDLGEVRPIELQVIGAQMQTEAIATLTKYQERGPKEKLVQRYLEEVVKDCGEGNQKLAEVILYLLTDENNTRPLKTHAELAKELNALSTDLAVTTEKLNLVLEIFVKSGLVFLLPEVPANRYQIVHDYLVAFIRQRRGADTLAELKKEREQRKQTEAELQRVLKRQLNTAITGGAVMTVLAVLAIVFGVQATFSKTNTQLRLLNFSSEAYFASGKGLEALLDGLRVGKQLKRTWFGVEDNTRMQVLANLQQAVYGVREVNRLEGHNDGVNCVSFSPDGQLIATGSKDKSVKLWKPDGTLSLTIANGHTKSVTSISFSPNGEIIASGSEDKTVKLWRRDGQLLKTLPGHNDTVRSISFSQNGKTMATGSEDKTAILWSIDGNKIATFKGHSDAVISLSISPDGKTIASSDGKSFKLWNYNGQEIRTIKTADGNDIVNVSNISFSPDGKTITAVHDGAIESWSTDGTLIKTITVQYGFSWATFSANSQMFAGYDGNSVILLTNEGLNLYLPGHSSDVTSLSFSPDGKLLASASQDNTVKLWNLERRDLTTVENKGTTSLTFSKDSQTIVTANDDAVQLWQRDDNNTSWLTLPSYSADVTLSPDGQTIASASTEDVVKIWSREGRLLNTLKGQEEHNDNITSISFSSDSQTIATASEDNTVRLWNREGHLFRTLKRQNGDVTSVQFSPDGQLLVSVSNSEQQYNSVKAIFKLWSSDGKEIKTLNENGSGIPLVSFSPDSQTIATVGEDNTVKLWRRDGRELGTLKDHKERITALRFSPDGQTIATASYDDTAKLWSLNGKLLQTLKEHNNDVEDVNFSSDGQTIATASDDKTVKLWRRD